MSKIPDTTLVETGDLVARVKLPKSLSQHQLNTLLNKRLPDHTVVAPIFFSSSRKEAFISLPELIIHFSSPTTQEEAQQWGSHYGFEFLEKLSLDNAFLFSCIGLDCIKQSRLIYELDHRVRYAYPNWIRPRKAREISFHSHPSITFNGKRISTDQGDAVTYQFTIKNRGVSIGSNVYLTGTLPTNVHLISAATSQGYCYGATTIQCSLGPLENQTKATITLRLSNIGTIDITNLFNLSLFNNGEWNNFFFSHNTNSSNDLAENESFWANDPLFQDQWYLENSGQGGGMPGADLNTTPVWAEGLTGAGLQIAIVDDGLEINHEDLKANTASGLHYDYVGKDGNPTAGKHGTAVAGIAAANGDNGLGIVGAAPNAELIGLRLLGATSDTNEAAALNYRPDIVDLSNNSWGPPDDGKYLAGPGPLTKAAIADGVSNGRNGKGIIYCWAGGNGGDNDNSNYDGYANSRYTIAVAASTNEGTRAYYSEKGANLLVNTPSSGGTLAVTSTDRSGFSGFDFGNYTDEFGGTSTTSPLACGAVALLLEANPDLSWRDVQYILATTTVQNAPEDADWTLNGAGYPVNHQYGFGRLDIAAAVEAARNWSPLGEEISVSGSASPQQTIPDNDPIGVSSHIEIPRNIRVEAAEVIFNADDHPYWGDLAIRLISPEGTVSVLAEPHDSGRNTSRYSNWRFTSVRHLGEFSQGTWTLVVRDLASGDTGTFQSWRLNLYGSNSRTINNPR
ncbi:MAG: S8 family serine peptidase [Methylothermaceae bacterium]|nr:S8 family serine peptidase [Methylothermaceae bacterium]